MASKQDGKEWVREWILQRTTPFDLLLDVGACDGIWADLLPGRWLTAVEAFTPNAEKIVDKYVRVYNCKIQDFEYPHEVFKLAIFGDVIEHMPVADAQKVLRYAAERCEELVVAVPYQYRQGAIYGNPFEVHVQDDLTPELMAERYPMLEMLIRPVPNYAYYHIKGRL